RRERESRRRRGLAQEPVGHLNEHARAVAGVRLAAAGAAVQEVEQDLQPLLDDAAVLPALDVDDDADPARIVLLAGIVEAGRAGRRDGHGPSVIAGHESEVKYNV